MKKILLLSLSLSFSLFAAPLPSNNEINVNTIYKTCLTCHGDNFEKRALEQSKIVKDMSLTDIKKALFAYKEKKYGGDMKEVMELQVEKIPYKDLVIIANKIKSSKVVSFKEKKDMLSKPLKNLLTCINVSKTDKDLKKCSSTSKRYLKVFSSIKF